MSTSANSNETTATHADDAPPTVNDTPVEDARSSQEPDAAAPTRSWRPGGHIGKAFVAVVFAMAVFGIYTLVSSEDETPAEEPVPTVQVIYEVSGTGVAEISYQGDEDEQNAVVIEDVSLPWQVTVDVPVNEEPIVQIILGAQGGEANCTLTVGDRIVQQAVATGEYGRATCQTTLDPHNSPTE
jgi:hypothetical protein